MSMDIYYKEHGGFSNHICNDARDDENKDNDEYYNFISINSHMISLFRNVFISRWQILAHPASGST